MKLSSTVNYDVSKLRILLEDFINRVNKEEYGDAEATAQCIVRGLGSNIEEWRCCVCGKSTSTRVNFCKECDESLQQEEK